MRQPIDEPGARLSDVINLIETRARARATIKFRTAAALGLAIPSLLLISGYFFINFVSQQAYDPLPQLAVVTAIGQLIILEIAIAALLWSRRRPQDQRDVTAIYSAVAASILWAVITGIFAGEILAR